MKTTYEWLEEIDKVDSLDQLTDILVYTEARIIKLKSKKRGG
tara:strand:- start:18978 stop:19103 length:126 start_codon:yes stop_codon:yes gene_type:complete